MGCQSGFHIGGLGASQNGHGPGPWVISIYVKARHINTRSHDRALPAFRDRTVTKLKNGESVPLSILDRAILDRDSIRPDASFALFWCIA
jgi:hypothetical protein